MDNKQRKKPTLRRTRLKSGFEVFSFEPILLGNWMVKASLSSHDTIFISMMNVETGEVETQFFTDETQANDFINHFITIDK